MNPADEEIVMTPVPGTTEEDLKGRPSELILDGKHHVRILKISNDPGKALIFDYEVLASTAVVKPGDPPNVGRRGRDYLSYNGGAINKLLTMATHFGWRKKGDPVKELKINWCAFFRERPECIIQTRQEMGKDRDGNPTKMKSPIVWGSLWPLHHPDVASVPRAGQTPAQLAARQPALPGVPTVADIPW